MKTNHQDGSWTSNETHAEQVLRASETSYRRLFEAAKDGILILDVDTGRINDVNPFLFNLLGFSRSEMVGKTVGELSPFKDIESNKVMLGRLQKDGYVRYENLPLETRDGRHIAVEFVSNVYEAGDCNVIQCNVRDITERKRIEEALHVSDINFHQLADNITDVFWITSPDLKSFQYISPGYELIWGRPVESLYANPREWVEAILPEERKRVLAIFRTLMGN